MESHNPVMFQSPPTRSVVHHRPTLRGVHGPSAEGLRECDPTSAWSSRPPGLWHCVPPTAWGQSFVHRSSKTWGRIVPSHYLVDLGGSWWQKKGIRAMDSITTKAIFCITSHYPLLKLGWFFGWKIIYKWGTVRLGQVWLPVMGILTPITGLMTIPEYGSRIQLLTMSHIDSQKAGHSSAPYELQTHFPRCTRMRGLLSSCWRIFWTHIGFFTIHPGWTGALLLAHPGKLGMESNEDTCYQKNVTFQEGIPIAPLIHPEDYYNSHAWTRWWPTKKKLYNPSANISTILGIVKWTINQLTYLGGGHLEIVGWFPSGPSTLMLTTGSTGWSAIQKFLWNIPDYKKGNLEPA